jgi:hypothetical protein
MPLFKKKAAREVALEAHGTDVGFKQAYFDFESTDLYAKLGVLLCASFLTPSGELWTLTNKSGKVLDDRQLAVDIRDTLEAHDLIMGWNSKEHDIRFLNARLTYWGERSLIPVKHVDFMWQFAKLKVGGRSLEVAARYFGLGEEKMKFPNEVWQRANIGDKEAIAQLIERCESDVRLTRDVASRLIPLVRGITT